MFWRCASLTTKMQYFFQYQPLSHIFMANLQDINMYGGMRTCDTQPVVKIKCSLPEWLPACCPDESRMTCTLCISPHRESSSHHQHSHQQISSESLFLIDLWLSGIFREFITYLWKFQELLLQIGAGYCLLKSTSLSWRVEMYIFLDAIASPCS